MTDERFLLALAIHPGDAADLAALTVNGWERCDPAQVAGTPAAYRAFVRGAKAEFGIAKQGYVAAGSGWFSDRSVCYLASGRPVIAQETGFSAHLPTGDGLFPFTTVADVLASISEINRNYALHARVAREIAITYFGSAPILTHLLEAVGAFA